MFAWREWKASFRTANSIRLTLIGLLMLGLAATALLTGCGGDAGKSSRGIGEAAPVERMTPEQKQFFAFHPDLEVVWDSSNDIPHVLRGLSQPVTGDPVNAALAFLNQTKAVYKMKDPASELSLRMVQKDELGYQHVRFYQKYQRLDVRGAELVVHINKAGRIYQITAQYYPHIQISIMPSIDEKKAISVGFREYQGKANLRIAEGPELVVYPSGTGLYLLTYSYVIEYDDKKGDAGVWLFYVDAHTERIINKISGGASSFFPPSGYGSITTITGPKLPGEGGAIQLYGAGMTIFGKPITFTIRIGPGSWKTLVGTTVTYLTPMDRQPDQAVQVANGFQRIRRKSPRLST